MAMYSQSLALKAQHSLLLPPISTNVINTPFSSQPSSPGPSVIMSTLSSDSHVPYPRKLLYMPTVRAPRLPRSANYTSRAARVKIHANSRLSRSRHMSVPAISLDPEPNPWNASHWFTSGCRFEVVKEHQEITGYQMYAVEKWIVERTRRVTVLVVFTGDPSHKIAVTALSPISSLSKQEADAEWEKGIHDLRRDGARPRETDDGTIMCTSLANFRSDYTIVHIPTGNFMEIREQLYVNINLLRMGCSGRSALTLEEPSETTKDRFIQMYQLPEKIRNPDTFGLIVLELVKLVQAGLALFGFFDMHPEERNGLLCDVTVDGVQRWIIEIGEPELKLEPTERIADPTMIAALLSLVLTIRNKLHIVGYNHLLPKDPFLEPHVLGAAVYAFYHSGKGSPDPGTSSPYELIPISRHILHSLDNAYEKSRQSDAYKVHKVLLNKLDDLTTDLRAASTADTADGVPHNTQDLFAPTMDLSALIKAVLSVGKEGAPSLRWLWTGRTSYIERKRKEHMRSDGEGDVEDRERRERGTDPKSTDEESDFVNGLPWSGRVQKKIESWAGLHRKKQSIDQTTRPGDLGPPAFLSAPLEIPSVVVSDSDAGVGSAQTSPTRGQDLQHMEDKEKQYFSDFNQIRLGYQSRISSWSDPVSAREILDDDDPRHKKLRASGLSREQSNTAESSRSVTDTASVSAVEQGVLGRSHQQFGLRRRHSFGDVADLEGIRVLPVDRLRIDVELCGHLLVMWRRERHLENVLNCLQIFASSLAETNAKLGSEHQIHEQSSQTIDQRLRVVAELEREKARIESATQEARALSYESSQFRINELWATASAPRLKVFALRERVFGAGRRVRESNAHGHFDRLQIGLNGRRQLVDALGRTEAEASEEIGLPRVVPYIYDEEEEPDAVPNPTMRPTWLLWFFHRWGARWSASSAEGDSPTPPNASASPPNGL